MSKSMIKRLPLTTRSIMRAFCSTLFPAIIIIALLGGCAEKNIHLPAVKVRSNLKTDLVANRVQSSTIDPTLTAEQLFNLGYLAFDQSQRAEALDYFKALVERYPNSPQSSDAAYNAGLIFHRNGEYEDAIKMYTFTVEIGQSEMDVLDARFRILACQFELKLWQESLELVDTIENEAGPLVPDDRIELSVRRGVALYHLDNIEKSKALLEPAFQDYQIGVRRGDVVNEYPGAMAAYYLAMLERKRFDETKLKLGDEGEMLDLMGKKALALQAAQSWFLKSIEQDNTTWATASGHQIGRLYHDFYTDIQQVPIPVEFIGIEEEEQMYRCMLIDKVEVLLKKAMRIYARTIEMGQRLRVKNRWIEQTQADLSEVESMYLEDLKACQGVLPDKQSTGIPRRSSSSSP